MLASQWCHIKAFLAASALVHFYSSRLRGSSFVLSLSANVEPIDGAALSNSPMDILKYWNQIKSECWTHSCPLSRIILSDPKDNFRRLESWGCGRLHCFSFCVKERDQNKDKKRRHAHLTMDGQVLRTPCKSFFRPKKFEDDPSLLEKDVTVMSNYFLQGVLQGCRCVCAKERDPHFVCLGNFTHIFFTHLTCAGKMCILVCKDLEDEFPHFVALAE